VAPAPVAAVWFDLYGTLVALGPLTNAGEAVAPGRGAALAGRWRQRQVEASWLTTLTGRWRAFDVLTREALRTAAAELGIDGPLDELDGAFERLPAAGEATAVLAALRSRGVRTGILSNGSSAMIERTLAASGLAGAVDLVRSVDLVERYKPDPAVYALAVDASAAAPDSVGFVTANGWDAAGAAASGLRVAWLRPDPRAMLPLPEDVAIASWPTLLATLGVDPDG
jgi:2-haloacid dehalogenase